MSTVHITQLFSSREVTHVIQDLLTSTADQTRQNWLRSVCVRTTTQRPDLAVALREVLGVEPEGSDLLAGLSIGEISVCYEALLAELDSASRKSSGQFFTPDDAASFMARHHLDFPSGVWLDPCCGVGNLSWHLAALRHDPSLFVRHHLVLIDRDGVALRSAVALLSAAYLEAGDTDGVMALWNAAQVRDFLSDDPLPDYDYAILNPPYARTQPQSAFATASTKDTFAYFLERVAMTSKGFIAVTPASYVSTASFSPLRNVLDRQVAGGKVFVFDNMPDTLFRGYKFGSTNTAQKNSVRAAITVCSPELQSWSITPIIRWGSSSRYAMFAACSDLLSPRLVGNGGEWLKIFPEHHKVWAHFSALSDTVQSLTVPYETPYALTVALTPRYYISATFRDLSRSSKTRLYFTDEHARDRVAVALNSTLAYLWWRAFDGGVTLPLRVLLSTPVPESSDLTTSLARDIERSESSSVVVKLNAGKRNENVKHSKRLVDALNAEVFPHPVPSFERLYSPDLFC